MELEDYKEIISTYQQKCFEFFNENIVLKTQINSISKKYNDLKVQNDYLSEQIKSLKENKTVIQPEKKQSIKQGSSTKTEIKKTQEPQSVKSKSLSTLDSDY
jgi:chromosome segregation ATPase